MTRIAFLGLGAASRSIHLPACRDVPGLEVVGGADPDQAARDAFQQLAPSVPLFDDATALFEALAPEWVLVAAPPALHRDLCLLALERGAHVVCEKPFVESLEDADAVVSAAKRAGRVVVVNHEFPFMPIHAALIDAARDGRGGRPLFLQAWQTVRLNEEDLSGWRSGWKTMQEFGTHVVDLAMHVFAATPASVTARMPRPTEASGDLVDLVVLEFSSGAAVSIVLNRICTGRHRYLELRLDTERASMRSSIGGRVSASVSLAPPRPRFALDLAKGGMAWIERASGREMLARNPGDIFAHATAAHLRAVLDAVADGKEPRTSARHAREVVRVVDAAYTSAREGRTVTLDET